MSEPIVKYEVHFCNPIPELDGYFASSAGCIFSNKRSGGQLRELSTYKGKSGYLIVSCQKKYPVHTLVARTWVANPHNLPMVNHKDGNKQNNTMENLEYVSAKENSRHAREILKCNRYMRPVCQLSLDGTLIKKYKSMREAQNMTGILASSIGEVCNGKRRTTSNYIWCHEEEFKGQSVRRFAYCKPVLQYDLYSGKLLARFESIKEAAKHVGALESSISQACAGRSQSCKGYRWVLEKKQEKKDETADWVILEQYPLYKISRDGRIFSTWFKRIKKLSDKSGYKTVRIAVSKNVGKHLSVHRLVAMAYLPNPNNYPIVNHKDGNPSNNTVENLEWCTHAQNSQHAHDTELRKSKRAVIQYSLDGDKIRRYNSITEAAKCMNIASTCIGNACKGVTKTSCNFQWKFA